MFSTSFLGPIGTALRTRSEQVSQARSMCPESTSVQAKKSIDARHGVLVSFYSPREGGEPEIRQLFRNVNNSLSKYLVTILGK